MLYDTYSVDDVSAVLTAKLSSSVKRSWSLAQIQTQFVIGCLAVQTNLYVILAHRRLRENVVHCRVDQIINNIDPQRKVKLHCLG